MPYGIFLLLMFGEIGFLRAGIFACSAVVVLCVDACRVKKLCFSLESLEFNISGVVKVLKTLIQGFFFTPLAHLTFLMFFCGKI